MQHPILSGINDPEDLKNLTFNDLNHLADEIRDIIVSTVAQNGGHLASNLGVVELSVALHRVFDSPRDIIVWDVGHQCYAHKLLTGRLKDFSGLRKAGGIAGFPKRSESPHDQFNTGHASTSISAALGLLTADRIQGGRARAVAVIGDGALTGGLAYEALCHAGQSGLPLVVILNDNKMSISPNEGGLSKYLSRLSMKSKYQSFRRGFDKLIKRVPFIGDSFLDFVERLKRAVKAVFYTDNFFVDLGFEYVGPIDGHNIQGLVSVLEDVRRLDRPVVIHVLTRKGKGYKFAEDDPGSYHGVSAFSVNQGIVPSNPDTAGKGLSFTEAFGAALLAAAERDNRVTALTAAMESGTGLTSFRKLFDSRFFDVGIAEEHAVTFASGLAARGLKPVAAIYSTFIQRAVDQIIHDAALQKLPITLALDRAGFVGDDGETHQGLFDIALFRSVPNTAILAPASESELRLMLDWALEDRGPDCNINKEKHDLGTFDTDGIQAGQGGVGDLTGIVGLKDLPVGPVIIRYPKAKCPAEVPSFSLSLEWGRGVFVSGPREDSRICLAFTGSLYAKIMDAAAILASMGIKADLYNLRFLKPVDENYLGSLISRYELMVFIEEGIASGGFVEFAVGLAGKQGGQAAAIAVSDHFISQGTREELLRMNGLDGQGIADEVIRHYRKVFETAEKHQKMGHFQENG